MKRRIIALGVSYIGKLRSYLRKASKTHAQEALELGRQSVALGLDTLELEQIHQSALDALQISEGKGELIAQAGRFFAAATAPIVVMHSEACRRTRELAQLKVALRERTSALNEAQRTLRYHSEKRKGSEAAFVARGKHCSNLLRESHQVQDRLRLLTHNVLKNHERQRSKLSHELQDDLAQNLLGINVRLLLLRTKIGKESKGLSSDLTETQRLVAASRRSMRKATRRIAAP